jgi:hypothetical protein
VWRNVEPKHFGIKGVYAILQKIMRFIYPFLISLFFSSCVLQKEEENFNNVSKELHPGNKSNIVYSYDNDYVYSPLKDSVWLTNQTYFELVNGDYYGFEVSVDGMIVVPFQQGNKFSLSASKFSKGIHSLQIKQRVKSGTGSLADKVRAEYVEYISNHVISTTVSTYTPIITNVSYFNGSAKISWNAYTRGDFQSYQIRKFVEGVISDTYQKYTITDPRQTSLLDTTYVGGNVYYQMVLNNGGTTLSSYYYFKNNYYAKPSLTVSNGVFNLSWNPPAAYNDVKDYTVYLNSVKYDHIGSTSKPSLDINSSSLLVGGYYSCTIYANAKGGTDIVPSYNNGVPVGKPIPYFSDVKHDNQKSSYYLYRPYQYSNVPEVLYQLDDTNFNVIDSLATPMNEADGKIVISSNNQYHYLLGTHNIIRFHPDNLSKLETSRYSDLVYNGIYTSFSSNSNVHGITDNNFLIFKEGGSDSSYVIDMNIKKLISRLKGTGHLSPDGKYLVTPTALYSFSTNKYVKVASIPYSNIKFMEFWNKNPSQLLIATMSTLIIYDCTNQTELFSYPITYSYVFHLDQSSNKVLVNSTTAFDLTTKTPYTIVNTAPPALLEGDALFFETSSPQNGGWVQKKY